MTPVFRRNSGFAMVTAIMLISLTVMTLTVLMATIGDQSRRALVVAEDAQLRQLLDAGADFAQVKLQASSSGRFSVPLPEVLSRLGADLTVEIQGGWDEKTNAEIEADLPHHRMSQHLTLRRDGDHWRIADATLDQ